MSKMEWVYNGPPDSPTFFEGEAYASPRKKPQPFDLFAPFQPVELNNLSEPEPEYYGASDPEEETLTPEAAFLKFAGNVYAPAEIAPWKEQQSIRRLSSESRQERIARLSAELAELEKESERYVDEDGLQDLSALRRQVVAIESASAKSRSDALSHSFIDLQEKQEEARAAGENSEKGVTLQLFSPDVSTVTDLERRVAALERMVGAAHEESCEGVALATLMVDIKGRLELLDDPGLPERLKQDASNIADVLRREVQSEAGVNALQTAEILRKMDKWEGLAETVPVVLERLRCLKRVQDEASGFVDALNRIEQTVDELSRRRGVNEALISNVEKSLRENVKTIQNNLNLLENRLARKS